MTALAARYGVAPSPRTAELPRAFAFGEFARGAAFAWLAFQPLAVIAIAVASAIDGGDLALAFLVPLFGLPYTLAATLVGSPAALVLGRRLRRQRRDPIHLLAFGVYGALWGVVVQLVLFHGGPRLGLTVPLTAATAGAVLVGWWATSRLALRADRRRGAAGTALAADGAV
jgi:hypothetical protein